jgi:hypothetical protein
MSVDFEVKGLKKLVGFSPLFDVCSFGLLVLCIIEFENGIVHPVDTLKSFMVDGGRIFFWYSDLVNAFFSFFELFDNFIGFGNSLLEELTSFFYVKILRPRIKIIIGVLFFERFLILDSVEKVLLFQITLLLSNLFCYLRFEWCLLVVNFFLDQLVLDNSGLGSKLRILKFKIVFLEKLLEGRDASGL